MKFIKHVVVAFAGMLLFSGCGNGVEKSLDEAPYNEGIHIIPQPVKVNVGQEQGRWTLTSSTKIIADESCRCYRLPKGQDRELYRIQPVRGVHE